MSCELLETLSGHQGRKPVFFRCYFKLKQVIVDRFRHGLNDVMQLAQGNFSGTAKRRQIV